MKLSRKLAVSLLSVVSLISSSFKRYEPVRPEAITIYTCLKQDTVVSPESISIAKSFLEEKLGREFYFVPVNETELATKKLDHIRHFAFIEKDKVSHAEEIASKEAEEWGIKEKAKALEDNKDKSSQELEAIEKSVRIRQTAYRTRKLINLLTRSQILDIGGVAYNKFSTAYLMPESISLDIKFAEEVNKDYSNAEEDYGLREVAANRLNRAKKNAAHTIVHELGHLWGLWHTHEYKEDCLEDILASGIPNAMSYIQPDENDKYGFDLEQLQINVVRSYLDGGEIYTKMEKANYDMVKYLKDVSNGQGWNK